MKVGIAYANLKVGHFYRVLGSGYDWYKALVNGKPVYVPKWVFEASDED